jgi:carboxymethylenebutenolidase
MNLTKWAAERLAYPCTVKKTICTGYPAGTAAGEHAPSLIGIDSTFESGEPGFPNVMFKKILSIFILPLRFLSDSEAQNTAHLTSAISVNHAGIKNEINGGGEFITLRGINGFESRVYAAGPADASAGILLVHDFFGITAATKESVEHLGALGYRAIAVDLYHGKSAGTQDSAQVFLRGKVRAETDMILKEGIRYLKRAGRKLATVGFSAGGIDAVYANLMEPESFSATVLIYAGDYDQIEKSKTDKLNSPILAITGSKDEWAVQSAFHFLSNEKNKSLELYIYPDAGHGFAQPLFLNGKNYDKEAIRMTWKLMEDFLSRHLKNEYVTREISGDSLQSGR